MQYLALDIGNVCLAIHPENFFRALGLPGPQALPPEVLFMASETFERGGISEENFLRNFRKMTGCSHSETELCDAFNSIIGEPVPGMAEQIEAWIAQGIQPVFFSDTSATHLAEVRRKFPAAHRIPDGIYSFETGAKKPEKAMFEAFESRFGRPVAYYDDRSELIAGAPPEWNPVLFRSIRSVSGAQTRIR